MYGCVYFSSDNTLSVVKDGQKYVSCHRFGIGESCEVKFKGVPFKGTIVFTSEKELDVKRKSTTLLKEVLHTYDGANPVSALIDYVKSTEKESEKDKENPQRRESEKGHVKEKGREKTTKAQKRKISFPEEMKSSDCSLLDTWNLIHGKVTEFRPSKKLHQVLHQIVQPEIQDEIKQMLKYFESKESKVYEEIGVNLDTGENVQDAPSTSNWLNTYQPQKSTTPEAYDNYFQGTTKFLWDGASADIYSKNTWTGPTQGQKPNQPEQAILQEGYNANCFQSSYNTLAETLVPLNTTQSIGNSWDKAHNLMQDLNSVEVHTQIKPKYRSKSLG